MKRVCKSGVTRQSRRMLSRLALATARNRGHKMDRIMWTEDGWNGSSLGTSRCRHCGGWLRLETHPAPNSVQISGVVVSLNCLEET